MVNGDHTNFSKSILNGRPQGAQLFESGQDLSLDRSKFKTKFLGLATGGVQLIAMFTNNKSVNVRTPSRHEAKKPLSRVSKSRELVDSLMTVTEIPVLVEYF